MKRLLTAFLVALAGAALSAARPMADTPPKVGQPAPAFSAVDDHGATRSLAEFRGKFVVLEWHNNGCPYVQKHYNSGNMQKLQKAWTDKGVVWLSIISSAPGTQGYVTPEQSQAFVKQSNASPTAVLLDPTGVVGHTYAATNTPQMFVIDPKGVLLYSGAIDDRPTANPASLEGATNYVDNALTEALAGKPVTTPVSVPYGCTVKYR
jgi:peroxiredoxin